MTKDGGETREDLPSGTQVLNLSSKAITDIDLSPLSSCTDLMRMFLSSNLLQTIDLSPLSSCTNMQQLLLSNNLLHAVDISPISSCTNLQGLWLDGNKLERLDLSPLASCKDLQGLWLSDNHLTRVDLTPLGSCTNLQRILLHGNNLQEIDLSPLASCSALQAIWLDENQLKQIDLSPLASCTSLQRLFLSSNQLQTADLFPLSSCTDLRELDLDNNQLKKVDLSPLGSCPKLRQLLLHHNELETLDLLPLGSCVKLQQLLLGYNDWQSLDLSPLSSCQNLVKLTLYSFRMHTLDITPVMFCTMIKRYDTGIDGNARLTRWLDASLAPRRGFGDVSYGPPSPVRSWAFLHNVAEAAEPGVRVSNDILRALCITQFGLLESYLLKDLLQIPAETAIDEARERVASIVAEKMGQQIDAGGTTIGLKLEEVMSHSEIALRAAQVAELRRAEMQRVVVPLRGRTADLRPLWLTAYGFDLLSALGKRLKARGRSVKEVRTSLSKIGFELQTTDSEEWSAPLEMSEEMKEYIWWIAEHRPGRARRQGV